MPVGRTGWIRPGRRRAADGPGGGAGKSPRPAIQWPPVRQGMPASRASRAEAGRRFARHDLAHRDLWLWGLTPRGRERFPEDRREEDLHLRYHTDPNARVEERPRVFP